MNSGAISLGVIGCPVLRNMYLMTCGCVRSRMASAVPLDSVKVGLPLSSISYVIVGGVGVGEV